MPALGIVGHIKSWSSLMGFGYIVSEELPSDVYFSRASLPPGVDEDQLEGVPVSFDAEMDTSDWRTKASNVQLQLAAGVTPAPHPAKAVNSFAPDSSAPKGADKEDLVAGVIKSYNKQVGFGFVNVPSLGKDARFTKQDVPAELQDAHLMGMHVQLELASAPDGKLRVKRLLVPGFSSAVPLTSGDGGSQMPQRQRRPPAVNAGLRKHLVANVSLAAPGKPKLRGQIRTYDPLSAWGTLEAYGFAEDIPFSQSWSYPVEPGQQVTFEMLTSSDGSREARNVCIDPQVPVEASVPAAHVNQDTPDSVSLGPFCEGPEFAAVIKTFGATRGYGFVTAPAQEADVYYRLKDLDQELQGMISTGQNIITLPVRIKVRQMPDGRWCCCAVRRDHAAPPGAASGLAHAASSGGVKRPASDFLPPATNAVAPEGPMKVQRLQGEGFGEEYVGQIPEFTPDSHEGQPNLAGASGAEPEPAKTQSVGHINSYSASQGYGFISPDILPGLSPEEVASFGDILFVREELPHEYAALTDESTEQVLVSRAVVFDVTPRQQDGRLQASNITILW